jgi:hypothetical protein
MSKGKNSTQYDVCGPNHVRVAYNPCGCVYQMEVDEAMSVTKMYALVSAVDTCAQSLKEGSHLQYDCGHPERQSRAGQPCELVSGPVQNKCERHLVPMAGMRQGRR